MDKSRYDFLNEFSIHLTENGVDWNDTEAVIRECRENYPDLEFNLSKIYVLMNAKEELLKWFYAEALKLIEASDSEPQTQKEFNELVFEGENSLYSQLIDRFEEVLNQNPTN